MKKMLLSHCDNRDIKIDMLVLHCSAQPTEQMVKLLDDLKLSTHYIVGEKGSIVQCVDEDKIAWHAGKSFWRGYENINSRSLGIELCSKSLGQERYGKKQIEVLVSLCRDLIKKYNIPAYNIVGHSDIAPTRKPDPGLAFPWQILASNGIGCWYDINDAAKVKETKADKLLSIIGYDTRNDYAIKASAYAFCRRFISKFVTKDMNITHLVDNILPNDFSFMSSEEFIMVLRACAYKYLQIT